MMDVDDYTGISGIAGSLTDFKMEYSILQNLYGLFGVTTVKR